MSEYPLHEAAYKNDANEIRRILGGLNDKELDERVSELNDEGDTPLHCAACKNNVAAVSVLMEFFAYEHAERGGFEESGETPIHDAIKCDYVNVLRAINTYNGTFNSSTGIGYVEFAAELNKIECLRFLFEIGQSIDIPNILNTSLLGYNYGIRSTYNSNVLRLLIDKGAPVNEADRYGDTPLHTAMKGHNREAISILIDAGADYTARNNEGRRPDEVTSNKDINQFLTDKIASEKRWRKRRALMLLRRQRLQESMTGAAAAPSANAGSASADTGWKDAPRKPAASYAARYARKGGKLFRSEPRNGSFQWTPIQ